MVGETVEVRILEIGRTQVKIGVVAPREVGIYRSEISQLNRQAAVSSVGDPNVRSAIAALRNTLEKRKGG